MSERASAGLPGSLLSASLPAADQAGTGPFTLSTGIYGYHLCVWLSRVPGGKGMGLKDTTLLGACWCAEVIPDVTGRA